MSGASVAMKERETPDGVGEGLQPELSVPSKYLTAELVIWDVVLDGFLLNDPSFRFRVFFCFSIVTVSCEFRPPRRPVFVFRLFCVGLLVTTVPRDP